MEVCVLQQCQYCVCPALCDLHHHDSCKCQNKHECGSITLLHESSWLCILGCVVYNRICAWPCREAALAEEAARHSQFESEGRVAAALQSMQEQQQLMEARIGGLTEAAEAVREQMSLLQVGYLPSRICYATHCLLQRTGSVFCWPSMLLLWDPNCARADAVIGLAQYTMSVLA